MIDLAYVQVHARSKTSSELLWTLQATMGDYNRDPMPMMNFNVRSVPLMPPPQECVTVDDLFEKAHFVPWSAEYNQHRFLLVPKEERERMKTHIDEDRIHELLPKSPSWTGFKDGRPLDPIALCCESYLISRCYGDEKEHDHKRLLCW